MEPKYIIVGLIGILILLFVALFMFNRQSPAPDEIGEVPLPTVDLETKTIQATIKTVQGSIELTLYPAKAPKTVTNFVVLAKNGFYDGTTFHRVVPDFVIQGGDPLSKTLPSGDPRLGTGGPGYQFEDEINDLKVLPGAIAMANSGPNTNGSQFFIVTKAPQPHLDGKHTVFGTVTSGTDVVLKIAQGDTIQTIEIQ